MEKNEPSEYAGVARIGVRFVRRGVDQDVRDIEEVVAVAKFEDRPATVYRGYGLTLNLGNYESARFEVSISMPCVPEDVDACDAWCRAWCEARAEKEIESVRGKKPEGASGAPKAKTHRPEF